MFVLPTIMSEMFVLSKEMLMTHRIIVRTKYGRIESSFPNPGAAWAYADDMKKEFPGCSIEFITL